VNFWTSWILIGALREDLVLGLVGSRGFVRRDRVWVCFYSVDAEME